ncbi:hypothetical protein DBV14_11890 [Variovorax sp. KBW07]|uniref:transporter n=1 Tax=Variovorax sp. KBW07 TaxID=2153358 RepID=UPI000F5877B2|nr:transporter [Variovorax sp. KBW07]RQO55449.1 hypothetical protein DBV14_11890 [Variovorax sp. KBW07]
MTRERLRRAVVRTATARRLTAPRLYPLRPLPRLVRVRTALSSASAWAAYLCGLAATQTHAAGGHHSVDDAAILDPGQCQVETWTDWHVRSAQGLLHIGPACRVGPVELGLNLEREHGSSSSSERRTVRAGPQIKWAFAINDSLSAGVLASANWQSTTPHEGHATSLRFASSSVVIPVTWQIDDNWRAHLNLGHDFHRAQPSTSHSGAALEWSALPTVSFVAERFRESNNNAWRAGVRWTPVQALSIDLSRAQGLRADAPAWWTLGFTWVFAR